MNLIVIILVIIVVILLVNYLYEKYVESRMRLIAVQWNENRKINKINKKIAKELRNK